MMGGKSASRLCNYCFAGAAVAILGGCRPGGVPLQADTTIGHALIVVRPRFIVMPS